MRVIRNLSALLVLAGLVSAVHAAYQTPISFTGTFTENFDEMGASGTTVPAGWDVLSLSGSHDDFAFVNSSGAITTATYPWDTNPTSTFINTGPGGNRTTTVNDTLTVNTFTGNTGVRGTYGYNFGLSTSSTDRALGSSPTGTAGTELQLGLQNTTGGDLNAFNIAYDIRRFTTTVNNNTGYASDSWGALEEFPGYSVYYSLNGGTNWTNVAALNPQNLVAGYLPATGPSVPNTIGVTNIGTTTVTLGSPWTAGSTMLLRWYDDNAQGPSPDQNLGLDNVVVSTVPEPASLAILAAGALALMGRRRRI